MSDTSTLAMFELPPRSPRSALRTELGEALTAAAHLGPTDRALTALALRLADTLDFCEDKLVAGLSGQLVAVLDRLGMSPKARHLLELDRGPQVQEVNPLDELALIRTSRRAAAVDAGP